MIAKEELNDWQEQKKITNIVLMGMGEPFYNYDNVKTAVDILKNKDGLNRLSSAREEHKFLLVFFKIFFITYCLTFSF